MGQEGVNIVLNHRVLSRPTQKVSVRVKFIRFEEIYILKDVYLNSQISKKCGSIGGQGIFPNERCAPRTDAELYRGNNLGPNFKT